MAGRILTFEVSNQRKIGATAFLVLSVLSSFCTPKKWQLELQPDDVDGGSYDEPRPDDGSLCLRQCERGEIARICYYKFQLEKYSVLGSSCGDCPQVRADCFNPKCVTADGFEQTIYTVNRRIPGPSIQVCKGDTILVDVINQIPNKNVTIHWHGVKQRGTPWMDGVPMVTQCPILKNQTLQYRFVPDESGTFLWQAHSGLQGIVGSLIVREPDSSNSLRPLYDFDLPSHVILVQDLVHTSFDDNSILGFLNGILEISSRNKSKVPDSYLINGRGIQMTNGYTLSQAPLTEFFVRHGYSYRFRVIGGTSLSCPFRLTIQGHQLLVISADLNVIKPTVVDSLIMSSGERYDVVLNASQPVCSYWILVEGVGNCVNVSQAALLRYNGCSLSNLTLLLRTDFLNTADRYTLNLLDSECTETSHARGLCVSQLQSPSPNHLRLSRQPDFRFLLNFDPHERSEDIFLPAPYNHLATQSEPMNNMSHLAIPVNAVIEILMINTLPLNVSVPCHIHGHDLYIVEQGTFVDLPPPQVMHDLETRLSDNRNVISRFLPSKDTVTVPNNRFSLVRILADNPGFWLLHCLTDHETSVIFQVGQLFDIPTPPSEWSTCNALVPNI